MSCARPWVKASGLRDAAIIRGVKTAQRVSLAAVVLVAAAVLYLTTRNRQPPFLPTDADHRVFEQAATCMVCHGPAGGLPQSKNHPLGNDCLRCHGRPS